MHKKHTVHSKCSPTETVTYYRAPGLAVEELVSVGQIESGNAERNESQILAADPEKNMSFFASE